jgi:hypothetical protein
MDIDELISYAVGPRLGDRVVDLVVKTDELITAWATGSTRRNTQITSMFERTSARARVEHAYRSIEEPRDVPSEIVPGRFSLFRTK